MSQAEAVRFCCIVAACKNKFNYFSCVLFSENKLIFVYFSSIVIACCCTADFTCVTLHACMKNWSFFERKNGTMLYMYYFAQ